jgi:NAD(P)H-hydrate epimerase
VQSTFPVIIFVALPETEEGTIAASALPAALGEVKFDAVAIGPGMTVQEETAAFTRDFVSRCEKPVVVDADGINAFGGRYEQLKAVSAEKPVVISPHSGELKRLTEIDVPVVPDGRMEVLRELVAGTGITLVHKGAPTLIAHSSGWIDVNVHGHPGLATAGSGDVLTGAGAGMLAQGAAPGDAARVGVYVHSRAAEIAAALTGERGMTAGDCSDSLPAALKELEELVP